MGAMTCLGDPMDLKNSHPLSFGGKVCSARHFATAAALRFSASSFALLVMISWIFFTVGVNVFSLKRQYVLYYVVCYECCVGWGRNELSDE